MVVIRVICFRRLFLEDYAMLLSLTILVGTAITIQILVKLCYNIKDVLTGSTQPSPNFLEDTAKGLRGHAALMVMDYIGIWLIKFSFLIFFSRLGNKITKYRIFWWIVLIFNIAAVVTAIGIIPFECLLSPIEHIVAVCTIQNKRKFSNINSILSCSLDAVGDVMIICFPIYVLWGVRIDFRKKAILAALFSLVAFTIVITVVRGSVFSGVYISIDQQDVQPINVAWLWLWFSIEYIISFIVACLISFRPLFAQKRSNTSNREERGFNWCPRGLMVSGSQSKGFQAKAQQFHKSVLDTFMTLEGLASVDDEMFSLPFPPTGGLNLDFERGEGSNRA
ncbi:hypothetical protein F4781DRAFT_445542 [Annulohypoxylon bovei var. microspora]|nr:hypothetical protein F4781DRAFT_445542 [Annulohypoxylon bovei var. microspora]